MSCNCHENESAGLFMPMEARVERAEMITATEKHFTLSLRNGDVLDYQPGQIIEAGRFGYGEIPLGLSSSPVNAKTFDIVVRKIGKVSSALCDLKVGDAMTVRGPFGNGFPIEELSGKDILIVAGGIGLCPVRSMIQYILQHREAFGAFTLMFGARTPSDLLFEEDLEAWRCCDCMTYMETVDKADGSWSGNVGVITSLFPKAVEIGPETRVIICGPPIMYKFVIAELDKRRVKRSNVFVDLERRMKCGVGKCGHCQINDKYVCLDGPVFRFSDIDKLEEAI